MQSSRAKITFPSHFVDTNLKMHQLFEIFTGEEAELEGRTFSQLSIASLSIASIAGVNCSSEICPSGRRVSRTRLRFMMIPRALTLHSSLLRDLHNVRARVVKKGLCSNKEKSKRV
jgi:hypothetical protein